MLIFNFKGMLQYFSFTIPKEKTNKQQQTPTPPPTSTVCV